MLGDYYKSHSDKHFDLTSHESLHTKRRNPTNFY